MNLFRTVTVVALAGLLQACACVPPGPQHLTFTGLVDSGGAALPVTTVLVTDSRGATTGHYVFVERGNVAVPGTLGPCDHLATGVLRCEWRDSYGRGHLHMRFSADRRSFDGVWGTEDPAVGDDPDALRWTGAR